MKNATTETKMGTTKRGSYWVGVEGHRWGVMAGVEYKTLAEAEVAFDREVATGNSFAVTLTDWSDVDYSRPTAGQAKQLRRASGGR